MEGARPHAPDEPPRATPEPAPREDTAPPEAAPGLTSASETEEPPLPAHRIVLRAATGAPPAALAFTLVLLLSMTGLRKGPPDLPRFVLFSGAGAAAAFALLGLAEGCARHVRPGRRPLVVLAVALGAGTVVAAALVWLNTLLQGRPPQEALDALLDMGKHVLSRPTRSLPGLIGLVFPLVGLGTVRARPRPWPAWAQALVAAVTGGVTYLLCVVCWNAPDEFVRVLLVFTLPPAAGVLALAAGPWLEAPILRALQPPEE